MAYSDITDVGRFFEVLKYYNINGYDTDLYLFVGKTENWNSVDGVLDIDPVVGDLMEDKQIRKNIIFLQKVYQSSISPVIERSDWVSGNVYSCSINEVANVKDYVRNSSDQVFRCIWNANGGESTVEPAVNLTQSDIHNPIELSDGYVWIYVTTINIGSKYQFFDNNWMPIQPYSILDDIDSDSIGLGQIDHIQITDGGYGYPSVPAVRIIGDGTVEATAYVSDFDVEHGVVRKITISEHGGNYTHAIVHIDPPPVVVDADASAEITDGRVSNIIINTGGSGYPVAPNVKIGAPTGSGGVQATAMAVLKNGTVVDVVVTNAGSGYTEPPSVTFSHEIKQATALASVSPVGGTASNPCVELGCKNVSLDVIVEGGNTEIPPSVGFTQVGLISKPKVFNSDGVSEVTDKNVIKAFSTLKYIKSTGGSVFSSGDTLFQSDGSVRVFEGSVVYDDVENGVVYLINTTGSLKPYTIDTSEGVNAGIQKTVVSYEESEFAKHTGNIVYLENREKTTHTINGNEQFRITISFY